MESHCAIAREDGILAELLKQIQNDLFDLGADLLALRSVVDGVSRLSVTDGQVAFRRQIDKFNQPLEALRSFVLPGGSLLAGHLHLARAVVAVRDGGFGYSVRGRSQRKHRYLFKSSFGSTFCFGALSNDNGKSDVLWVPEVTSSTEKDRE